VSSEDHPAQPSHEKRRAQRRTGAIATAGLLLAALAIWGWSRQHAHH